MRRIDAAGYGDNDAFYEAIPRYTFWYTCNEWTRRALAAAGVRTAIWAPFDTASSIICPMPARRAELVQRADSAAYDRRTIAYRRTPRVR